MSRVKDSNHSRFVIWGKNLVFEALKSDQIIRSLFIYKNLERSEIEKFEKQAKSLSVSPRFVERDELFKVSGTEKNQGVVAVLEDYKTLSLKEGMEQLKTVNSPRIVVVLDSINDPQNLGNIIRTLSAAGANLLILNEARSCPVTETVINVSAGGIFYIPIATGNVASGLRLLKDLGFWVYGFEADGEKLYTDVSFSGDVALVFGSEGEGLRELTRRTCDMALKIPISGEISSLNVAVSLAVGLYEVIRQHGKKK